MKYLPLLSDDEIQRICSIIPPQNASVYFQHYPKEFAKVMPGFRPNAITKFYANGELLFKHRNKDFISSFIEDNVKKWLEQIHRYIEKCIEGGDDEDTAYINTLARSLFADNIAIYFKLTEKEYTEEYISLLSAAVKEAKKAVDETEKQEMALKSKDVDIANAQSELDSTKSTLSHTKEKYNECLSEIGTLKNEIKNLGKTAKAIVEKDETITELKAKIQGLEQSIKGLKAELSATQNSKQQLEAQIRDEIEKQHTAEMLKSAAHNRPLRPKDIDDFKEYLGYNLKDIGIPAGLDFLPLLTHHLGEMLFRGIPIIISRSTGISLMGCVANALVGEKNISTLVYGQNISTQDINAFLCSNERVVCLDNFIGNYNETELLPLFDRHRNKIIFLTVAYDRTMRYVPLEFLKYCEYLNLNRIKELLSGTELDEDPSVLDEIEVEDQMITPDYRYSPLLKEMLGEFGICQSLSAHWCMRISSEQDLCRVLTFNILPFCTDVLQISPFSVSERLVKYAGDKGRCSYKNLFKEWFA